MLACLRRIHSRAPQVKAATPAASVVVMKAWAPTPSAARAEPALKPYQPTQSMPVPTAQSTMLCGVMAFLPKPMRGPRMMQSRSADQPEVMWTTVPPAKSIALMEALAFQTPFISPVMPQMWWAIGK